MTAVEGAHSHGEGQAERRLSRKQLEIFDRDAAEGEHTRGNLLLARGARLRNGPR